MTNESCCNWRRSNFHFTIIREAGKCLSNSLTPYFIYFKYAPVYLCDLPSKSMPSYQKPEISLLDISMPYLFLGIFQHWNFSSRFPYTYDFQMLYNSPFSITSPSWFVPNSFSIASFSFEIWNNGVYIFVLSGGAYQQCKLPKNSDFGK